MKPEKILEYINAAMNHLPDEQELFDKVKNSSFDDGFSNFSAGAILAVLCKEIERDMVMDGTKKIGKQTQYKALERIWKDAVSKNEKRHSSCAGTYEADGYRCLCDGYRAVRISNESIPMPQEALKDGEPFNLDPYFNGLSSRGKIELPSAAWVKSQIKIKKAEAKARGMRKPNIVISLTNYDGDAVFFNAQYIVDILESIPGHDTATLGGKYEPLYMSNKDCEGIVLPVRYQPDRYKYVVINCPESNL